MADQVKFTKDGLKFLEFEDGILVPAKSTPHVYASLRTPCLIEEGVTLADIFAAVSANFDLLFFCKFYSWCDVQMFHEAAMLPAPPPSTDEEHEHELIALEIKAQLDLDGSDNTVAQSFGFSGISRNGQSWSLAVTPMCHIATLPVILNGHCPINRDWEKLIDSKYVFTLLNVLDAIYYDISFYGGPQETATLKQELLDISAKNQKLT